MSDESKNLEDEKIEESAQETSTEEVSEKVEEPETTESKDPVAKGSAKKEEAPFRGHSGPGQFRRNFKNPIKRDKKGNQIQPKKK
jgi:hypothetical protein